LIDCGKLAFLTAKDANPESYQKYWKMTRPRDALVGAGLYRAQLRAWATHFPHLLVLEADDSRTGLQRNIDRMSDFLGLPDSHELDPEPDIGTPFSSSLSSELLTAFFQGCSVDSLVQQHSAPP